MLFRHIFPKNEYFYNFLDKVFMKLLTTLQIKELDKRTIEEENITSYELMERAATALSNAIMQLFPHPRNFKFFAGPGNNGGDALAVARMLSEKGYQAEVWLFNTKESLSPDCQANAERLLDCPNVTFIEVTSHFAPPTLHRTDVIIDGLFGSGLNKPLDGGFAAVVRYINASSAQVISLDIPSGLMGEDNTYNIPAHIIRAQITLTLQMPKLAFLFAENQEYVGEWFSLHIGLSEQGIAEAESPYHITNADQLRHMMKARKEFSHKGHYGRALLIAGSYGMAGASVLSAKACMRSGAGVLTVHAPHYNTPILQTAVPEAMVQPDEHAHYITTPSDLESYDAIAIGPGLGQRKETAEALLDMLKQAHKPLILDADALNILSANKLWLALLPKESILTPHPKELERLVGHCTSGYERLTKARELAEKCHIYVILKGAWSTVIFPDGSCHFNPTGNPGMATGGSGDVLTGVLLGLSAQGYSPAQTALLGTYLHGVAGDIAATQKGENGMIASDIVEKLPLAWSKLEKNQYLCANKEQKCG